MIIYKQEIDELIKRIPKEIIDIDLPRKKTKPPTQAFSEFLTNREQGDWAEKLIFEAVNGLDNGVIAVKYGKPDDIIAGENGFKEFYENYQNELDSIGKRPDLLIFDKNSYKKEWNYNISFFSTDILNDIVPKAIAGIEVRSSSFLVEKYNQNISKPKTKQRGFLSFTPKVEDIKVVCKWIETYGVPHFYFQVFFDKVYGISFFNILQLIAEQRNKNEKFFLEKDTKNQLKTTIKIDVNEGVEIASKIDLPEHESKMRELGKGRLLFHVTFQGGSAYLNVKNLYHLLNIPLK